jgi:hypothetical protein
MMKDACATKWKLPVCRYPFRVAACLYV